MVQYTQHTRRITRESTASAHALAAALDLVHDGVLLLDANLVVQAANARASELLGDSGLCGSCLADGLPPAAAARLRASARAVTATPATKVTLEIELLADAAGRVELALHASEADESAPLVGILRPARVDTASVAAFLPAERDYLTGLATRAVLSARLQAAESRGGGDRHPYAILFLDIDEFKRLNDELGHAAGDRVLAVMAQRLLAAVRPGDLVVRYGGDEFVIVVDDVSPPQLARLARRLRTTLAAPLEVAGQWRDISVSIGRALGDTTRPATAVLDEADRAMYRSKLARRRKRPR